MRPSVSRLAQIRHVALDMDGTIYLGDSLFPYTLGFLHRLEGLGIGYSFLTNNPSSSRADYAAKLSRMGIRVGEDEIYTTVQATVDYIRTHFPGARRLFLLGTPSMTGQFEGEGFVPTADDPDDRPDLVVVSFDRTLSYSRLCRACWWIKEGLPYIATNPDKVCPTDSRTVLVDCGSICAAIAGATGRRPDVTLGKPDPNILCTVARDHGIPVSQLAMVGDRIYTDIAAGINAGAVSVLVLSGETDEKTAAESGLQPDYVLENVSVLGYLLEEAAAGTRRL